MDAGEPQRVAQQLKGGRIPRAGRPSVDQCAVGRLPEVRLPVIYGPAAEVVVDHLQAIAFLNISWDFCHPLLHCGGQRLPSAEDLLRDPCDCDRDLRLLQNRNGKRHNVLSR